MIPHSESVQDLKRDDTRQISKGCELIHSLFKNIFVKEQSLYSEEDIIFYRNNEGLFKPTNSADLEYTDFAYEKLVVNAGINGLVTGSISAYGNFIPTQDGKVILPEAIQLLQQA